ncbi:MAG: hypothetical protein KDI71_10330 [Xanthomonadales bacterium]|nr:hypothetical protein [Xanthomonadales bacterium]
MTPLTDAVAQMLATIFPIEARDAARQLIAERCWSSLPLASPECEPASFDRIRFAVIKLSAGDLERLRRVIDRAHADWRDILLAADFGEDINAHLSWNP